MIRRVVVLVLAVAVGLVGGGAIGFLAQGTPPATVPASPQPGPDAADLPVPRVEAVRPDTILAWTPGGLLPGFADRVGRLPRVAHMVPVVSGVVWLTASRDAEDEIVDRPPRGMGIPLEVAGADLRAYEPFLSPADRTLLASLAKGQAVLGATSAKLRGLEAGATLVFGSRRVRVAGVLPDTAIGAHEVFVSRATAAKLGVERERYMLIDPGPKARRQRLAARIRGLLPEGALVQIRGPGETPFFRHGDAVLPQVIIKDLFGEFAGRPASGGLIRADPRWERTHIVSASVPILGVVRCNRALIPLVRKALGELARAGMASLIERGEYGGCYSSRFLNFDPNAGLSHHAWGVAIDINALTNQYGRTPRQDPRLVAAFERWGFTWGGKWLRPDGMHFEFLRFPTGS